MKQKWVGLFVFSVAVMTYFSNGRLLQLPVAHARPDIKPNVVTVVAREYQFEMPDTIPSGPTLFHLTDEGKQLHHVTLIKLEQGKTLNDFTALPPGPLPGWAVFMGGPNVPAPTGGQARNIVDLSPGNYAVICLVPGPDGKPHMMNGMVRALTVTEASEPGKMPAHDLTLTLTNYKFTLSEPLTAGEHVIRIVNNGDQVHEAVMFRLEHGKTGQDIFNWVGGGLQGPPPAVPVGGVSAESPGMSNLVPVHFTAGNYALICFVPDATDGQPHAAHGMIYDFKVM